MDFFIKMRKYFIPIIQIKRGGSQKDRGRTKNKTTFLFVQPAGVGVLLHWFVCKYSSVSGILP